MSGFLAPPIAVLVVQEKPDYPIFAGLKPQDRPYPFTVFLTYLSLSLKNNHEGDPKTPFGDSLVPPWNLRVLW
jgi:hypothetical protein